MKVNAWDVVVECLILAQSMAKIGVRLIDIDAAVEKKIIELGAESVNKGYMADSDWQPEVAPKSPFPNALVVNVNSTIVHGTPTEYVIADGDTIGFDLGVKKDGVCGDAAVMVGVGEVGNNHDRMMRHARMVIMELTKIIKAGVSVASVGRFTENFVSQRGYVVNQTFAGHGIGEKMHMDPIIPTYYRSEYEDVLFEEGKMYCLEVPITFKDVWGMRAFNDWAWITRDGRRSAMWEHQILVTKTGCEILTKKLFS